MIHKIIELVFTLGGLLLTTIGAAIAAKAVIITDEQADLFSGKYYDDSKGLRDSLMSQSRNAKVGLLLIFVGTLLQIFGTIFAAL